MTLPSSGPLSIAQIAAEFNVPLPCVFPNAFWGKPGIPASGALTLPGDFYGKSNVTFTPPGGAQSSTGSTAASVTLNCNLPAVWTYSGGGLGSSVSLASGGSATSINFSLNGPFGSFRSASWTVTGVSNGVSASFTVNLETGDA